MKICKNVNKLKIWKNFQKQETHVLFAEGKSKLKDTCWILISETKKLILTIKEERNLNVSCVTLRFRIHVK